MEDSNDPPCGDATGSYIVACRPVFEQLNRTLTQVAGYALLVMTRGGRLPLLDAPVAVAHAEFHAIRDALKSLRVPAAVAHHHSHVTAAMAAVARCLDLLAACLRANADDAAREALVRCLRIASDHLRAATRLLPGFAMVDLGQACCARHAGMDNGSAHGTLFDLGR